MRSKQPLIEQLYGYILVLDREDTITTYSKILPEFNKTGFQKRFYEATGQLIKENKTVDMLSVLNQFKNNGWFDKTTAVQISGLSTSTYNYSAMYSVSSIIEALKLENLYENALVFRNKLENLLETENFTFEKYNELIQEAKEITYTNEKTASNVDRIFTIIDKHIKAKNGELPGIGIGYYQMDRTIMLEPVDLMVIGARPAMGKTAFGVNTAVRLALKGKRVVFFALEMTAEQVLRRVIGNLAQVDTNRIKYGECTTDEIDRIYLVQQMAELQNLIIIDGSKTVNEISADLNEAKRSGPIDIFIVDYLQKIQPKTTRSRYEAVTEISNGLKLICQNMKIPGIAFAQLSRDSAKLGKRPTLPDLKESGEIEQDASIVAFLHRPEYYGEETTVNGNDARDICEFIVAKNREGDLGIFELKIDLKTSKFE